MLPRPEASPARVRSCAPWSSAETWGLSPGSLLTLHNAGRGGQGPLRGLRPTARAPRRRSAATQAAAVARAGGGSRGEQPRAGPPTSPRMCQPSASREWIQSEPGDSAAGLSLVRDQPARSIKPEFTESGHSPDLFSYEPMTVAVTVHCSGGARRSEQSPGGTAGIRVRPVPLHPRRRLAHRSESSAGRRSSCRGRRV